MPVCLDYMICVHGGTTAQKNVDDEDGPVPAAVGNHVVKAYITHPHSR